MMSRRLIARVLPTLFIILSLFSPGVLSTTQAQKQVPRFENSKCFFTVPRSATVNCGYLIVSENRTVNNGKTIKIAVAVFKAKGSKIKPDPVIYLDGGPGGHTLEVADLEFSYMFKAFGANRDFIMFDQRGVGFSQPALDCPERTDVAYENLTKRLTSKQKDFLEARALAVCHDRFVEAGIDLSAYNTAENAADVNDLLTILGYHQWNLYGISYGTRLALTMMRDFPTNIRSVLIDSVVPLQADLYGKMAFNADRAFQVFFQGCLKNLRCNAAWPNLDKIFYQLVKDLNTKPITINVKQPYTGKNFKVLMDGDVFISMLFGSLYSSSIIVYLPKVITEASQGDYHFLERFMGGATVKEEFISYGMYFSVQCQEELPFDTPQALADADKNFPKLNNVFNTTNYYNICQMWNVKPADPIENKAVVSNIPTLILEGQYDPITPPSYGYLASQSLHKSFLFQFTGIGHGVSVGDPCPYELAVTFFDMPTVRPNIGCMTFMEEPEFITR